MDNSDGRWHHMEGGVKEVTYRYPDETDPIITHMSTWKRITLWVLDEEGKIQAHIYQEILMDDWLELVEMDVFAWLLNEMVEKLEYYLKENEMVDRVSRKLDALDRVFIEAGEEE